MGRGGEREMQRGQRGREIERQRGKKERETAGRGEGEIAIEGFCKYIKT